jgi:WD40 repeat protein/DNA-binding SARP family transcriptional activator
MQIRVLGPLEASVDDRPVALGGAKQRAVLAMLGLEANRAVTADRLIEGLWGEQPPPSAAKMVQNYIWRLRKLLEDDGGAEIVTRGRGYELRIDRELVDACRLEQLVAEASRSAAAGEPGNAARAALGLFRGDPLADVADEPFANPEIRRLEELRLTAAELAIDADLASGRHQELVGEIEGLLADNPLRERLHAQRMLALYRCGRQAEALEAYRQARQTLVEQIGIEPSPDLQRLHDEILRQDPSLAVEPAATELPRELDAAAASPLIGRDDALRRLRDRWQRAAAGSGSLVTLAGAYGIGKTRTAAEIAGEAHREGAAVLFAAGTGPPEAALAAIARARETRRPALVVLDDADRAPADVRIALRDLASAEVPVLVLATGQEAAPLARLEPRESLVLEPLDESGVQAIAGFYAPSGDGAVPVEALLAASRGVPRRVHEAASEWARHEATRRVDAAAGRAAAGRTEARALVAELAGSVVDLQSTRERTGLLAGGEGDERVVCPYKGLAPFGPDDADYFFGRERLVAELVARLVGTSLLAVVGPSGSGKSSAVRAGLLPALAGGVLPGSDAWAQALIRPGAHPLAQLAGAARELARGRRGVLAVDQFEELFTACEDEDERAAFIAALLRVSRDGIVVIAIRADFYGRCAAYPELSRLVGANHVLVGPMSRDELRRAIERPAERTGLTVEPELVESLLADVEGRPGALPLLSTALLELWRRRDGRRLVLAAYARSGGVQGAVARLAEDAYLGLDQPQRDVARRVLLRLTDEGERGGVVRRRVALGDLGDASGVVSELADRRLLTVDDGAVEVAHEALLREWPRLRAWLDEDVEGRQLHRRLGQAARAWDADGRDPGGLYRGGRLAAALEWAAAHDADLTPVERAFLEAGRRTSGRAQRRLRMVLAAVASLLVIAVGAGLVALDQRGRARAEATAAAAQRLGAEALADEDLDRSLLLARQGVALHDSLQTRSNLFAALLKSPAAIGVVGGDGSPVSSIDLSPDDRTLAYMGGDGVLFRVDSRTRRPAAGPQTIPGHVVAPPDDVRFSDDGALLAVGGTQPQILDARSSRVISQMRTSGVVQSVRFSPDARTLIAVVDDLAGRSFVQRFDVRSGAQLDEPRPVARGLKTVRMVLTSDGRRAVTAVAGGPVRVHDARTLRPLARMTVPATAVALSHADRTLLAGARDGSVRFVDFATGRVRAGSGRHDGAVTSAAISADGHTAVTAGEDGRAIVWDVDRAAPVETLAGHSGVITGVAISGDGRRLYSAGLDGKVVIWDLAGDSRVGRRFDIGPEVPLLPPRPPIASHALSHDGRSLAVGQADGMIAVFDARTLRERASFRAVTDGSVLGMAYLPEDRLLAVGGEDGFLALFDPVRGELVRRLRGHAGQPVGAVSVSADGRLMVTSASSAVLLWTLRSGEPVHRPRTYRSDALGSFGAALTRDGRTLAVATHSGVAIVDTGTLSPRVTLPPPAAGPFGVGFTADGRYLAVGRSDGSTELWSAETWQRVPGELGGHNAAVLSLASSPDGDVLATGSTDGTVRLFDVESRRPLGAPLRAVSNRVVEPRFTPDGAFLFAITDAGSAYRWDVRPSAWARHACAVAGRTLTREEWSDELPGREYDPAC